MKPCPSCKGTNIESEYNALIGHWTFCRDCMCTGPVCDTKEKAEAGWEALPRRAEGPDFRGSVYAIDGIEYRVTFQTNGPVTLCGVVWKDKRGQKRMRGVQGCAVCNPKDAYDQNIGERLAMKRACGIGNKWSLYDLRPLYDAWRKDQRVSMGLPLNAPVKAPEAQNA